MATKFLTLQEAAKRAGKDEFLQNVKEAVIPRLIAKGLLHGKKVKNQQLVADDEALARVMQLGIEAFVQNQQGYSFSAVRAPIDQVASRLQDRPAVAKYEPQVKPLKMKSGVGVQPVAKLRHAFLVQFRPCPEWSILVQTVHWFESCDAILATALAAALSRELHTLAAAAWDDDFSGSSLIVCENGKQKSNLSEEDPEAGYESFYEFFYEEGICLPKTFIGTAKNTAILYVADPAAVQRADLVVLKVPPPVETKAPHVFEKIGMMAQAIEEGLEDEEAFMNQMRSGIWQQAESVLAAGHI